MPVGEVDKVAQVIVKRLDPRIFLTELLHQVSIPHEISVFVFDFVYRFPFKNSLSVLLRVIAKRSGKRTHGRIQKQTQKSGCTREVFALNVAPEAVRQSDCPFNDSNENKIADEHAIFGLTEAMEMPQDFGLAALDLGKLVFQCLRHVPLPIRRGVYHGTELAAG
jgi:hypothetical protein